MREAIENILCLLRYDPDAPLLFSSGLFLFLFLFFSLGYWWLRKTTPLRIVYVILFSLYFYYLSGGYYFVVLLFVAMSDFTIAHLMHRTQGRKARKGWVALSLVINLGLLAYFKYTNFLISIWNDLSTGDPLEFKKIFLPVGVSFFLFQSLSYTIDVYRRRIEPLKNPLDYLFYLSFFPQLVAGPIVRARDFIPQIRQKPVVTDQMLGAGLFLILTGLFKKAVISDYISLNFVDRIFDNPALYSGVENLLGVYGYAIQIYCDFSGYSDMAIGLALLLGFHFNVNFDSPYKSASITEFWRRWHISLSSWLRDYLYISLGGNRKGKFRTYLNLMITMLLGGLWHGASMRFLIWGGLHGAALAVEKWFFGLFPRVSPMGKERSRWGRVLGIAVTFHIVCSGWVLFRAADMERCKEVFRAIFTNFSPGLLPQVLSGYAPAMGLIALGFVLHFLPGRSEQWGKKMVERLPFWGKALAAAAVIWLVMQVKSSGVQPFIYFQF